MTMSFSHHSEKADLVRRFMNHVDGIARREWPEGRLGADDEGLLAFAVAADPARQTIHVVFPKPVKSLAMSADDAAKLCELLGDKLLELRGITPI